MKAHTVMIQTQVLIMNHSHQMMNQPNFKKEMNQIHERDVFEPIHPHELTKEEKRREVSSFLQKKRMEE